MRILVGCASWDLIGGSERYARAVVPALRARGHQVLVLHAEGREGRPSDPRFLRLESVWAGGKDTNALESEARAFAPDVTYLLSPFDSRVLRALASCSPLVRFVQDHTLFCPGLDKMLADGDTCERPMGRACLEQWFFKGGCHGFRPKHAGRPGDLVSPFRQLRNKKRELEEARECARLFTASKYMRAELIGVGCDPETVSVLPYFTDSATSALPPGPLPDATHSFVEQSDAPLIVSPARLALPDKGIDHLLTALAGMRTPYRAVIAGSGPAENWLRQKAAQDGVDANVHFAGWLGAAAMETLYARADIVAFPSIWDEPFGLVGIEAMAHRTPVVAFEGGGISEWLKAGETGLAVPRRDTQALAQALDLLAEEPELRAKMGAAGRERVDQLFRQETHIRALERRLARVSGSRIAESQDVGETAPPDGERVA